MSVLPHSTDYAWLIEQLREELEPLVSVNDDSFPVEYGSSTVTCPMSSLECPDEITTEIDFDDCAIPLFLDIEVNDVELRLELLSATRAKNRDFRCKFKIVTE